MASLERGEHIGIFASFENVSQRNNTLHVFHTNDETRNNFSDEVTELSVPGTHLDRQPHTHHSITGNHLLSFLPMEDTHCWKNMAAMA